MIVLFAIFALVLSGTSPEGIEFLAKNKLNPGVVELPSGLQYQIVKNGYGLFHPNEDTACRVKFKGMVDHLNHLISKERSLVGKHSRVLTTERRAPPRWQCET